MSSGCIENSVDPDQLASSEGYGSTLFTRVLISEWFHTDFESVNCLSTERYKGGLPGGIPVPLFP